MLGPQPVPYNYRVNLPELAYFRKEAGQTALICLVIVLVGVGAFILGRLSVQEGRQAGAAASQAGTRLVGVREVPTQTDSMAESGATAGSVVASKTGSKYHFPWCAGARSIKEANKIWFASTKQAREAGYTPASNCKGLE